MTRKQICRVAVIGAGISGVVSAAHLLQNGIEVVVFERNPAAGGVWYASRTLPLLKLIQCQASRRPTTAGTTISLHQTIHRRPARHNTWITQRACHPQTRAAWVSSQVRCCQTKTTSHVHSPAYDSLKNNVSTPLMRVKLGPWPEGTPDYVSHTVMKEYIQTISQRTGVEDATIYGARVTDVYKKGDAWRVHWTVLRDRAGVVERYQDESVSDSIWDWDVADAISYSLRSLMRS